MKKLFLLSLCSAAFFSCQEDTVQIKAGAYPQTWNLVKTTGQFPASVRTGAELPWKETFTFQADSTFTKTRKQGDETLEASGTFSVRGTGPARSIRLTYPAKDKLVNNCTATPQETLLLEADTLISSSQACDGPRLEYKQVQ